MYPLKTVLKIAATTSLVASAYILTIATAFAAINPENSRPTIILMTADDLGWGDVGYNGNMDIETPHLDAMAGDDTDSYELRNLRGNQ